MASFPRAKSSLVAACTLRLEFPSSVLACRSYLKNGGPKALCCKRGRFLEAMLDGYFAFCQWQGKAICPRHSEMRLFLAGNVPGPEAGFDKLCKDFF